VVGHPRGSCPNSAEARCLNALGCVAETWEMCDGPVGLVDDMPPEALWSPQRKQRRQNRALTSRNTGSV